MTQGEELNQKCQSLASVVHCAPIPSGRQGFNDLVITGNAVIGAVEWTAMDPNPPSNLEAQVIELRARVGRLEKALHDRGIVLQKEEPLPLAEQANPSQAKLPVTAVERGVASVSAAQEIPVSVPHPGFSAPVKNENDRSLENRIGSQWFNRIGILAVLIGMAWFLKLAIDNHWIGPLGRVLIGLLAGAGLIAWSERFRSRGYAVFSYSLKAVGSGVLYLSLWAAFSIFHLIPSAVAFVAMIAVTAFNGLMAWIQDAELLALYAIVGALSTPLLLSTGGNHEVALFSYLLLMDLAVLVLVALRPWSRLLFSSFTGTVFFFIGWWFNYYSDTQFAWTAFFLSCFFLIFAFAPRLVRLDMVDNVRFSRWDNLALTLSPVLNAGLGFLAYYNLFDREETRWAGPWLAVAFAAFYLLLLRLPAQGVLRGSPSSLSALHLASAVVFLTIAIPLKAQGRWLTVGWLTEGAALLWVASRVRSQLLRVLSVLCLALGLFVLVGVNPPASTTPFFNERFGAYCVGIAAFAFVAWVARKAQREESLEHPFSWPTLAVAAMLAVNALILLSVGLEIHSYWWFLRWRGDWHLVHDYRMYAHFTYSAFFMIFGAILLVLGFWRGSSFLRWQALLLLALAIGKVFLVDVSELSQGYRILSFLGLGALLLAVSFIYQRDWLNLRGSGRRAS